MGSTNSSSSSIMASGGLRLANSSPSSFMATTSISGLSGAMEDDEGDSTAGIVDSSSLPDSMLCLASFSGAPGAILLRGVGEGGEEEIEPRGGAVRRFRVTLLDVGSGEEPCLGLEGVRGGAEPSSEPGDSSTEGMEPGVVSMAVAVSTERLREPPREVRWRFLETGPLLSSKGLGRVEQGSEEAARSRDNAAGSGSIWQRGSAQRGARASRRGGCRWPWLCARKLNSLAHPK